MAKSELGTHFSLINDSTYFGNLNTGQFIDPTRHNLNEKNQTFGNIKKVQYNSNDYLGSPESDYGQNK